jgi:hypothetical protein
MAEGSVGTRSIRLKNLIPLRVRTYGRKRQHAWQCSVALRRGIRRLKKDPRGCDQTWRYLVDGWDNKRWSAGVEYLDAVAAAAVAERGPILECGSGLTTLVLATIARRTRSPVWTLEHDARCFQLVQSRLHQFGLSANVRFTPLHDYGDFDWYGIDASELPTFSLVVCDGPPKASRGGRVGLLPVLGERLAPGCVILLDDAARADERDILRRWASDVRLHYDIRGERPFAVVELA